MRVKIAKWGNSAAIRLPKVVMDELRLAPGSEAELTRHEHEIRISPIGASERITLEKLIASMDKWGPEGQTETLDWGPDRGSEVIDDDYSQTRPSSNGLNEKKRVF